MNGRLNPLDETVHNDRVVAPELEQGFKFGHVLDKEESLESSPLPKGRLLDLYLMELAPF